MEGNSLEPHEPKWSNWLRCPTWTLLGGVFLLLNIEPDDQFGLCLMDSVQSFVAWGRLGRGAESFGLENDAKFAQQVHKVASALAEALASAEEGKLIVTRDGPIHPTNSPRWRAWVAPRDFVRWAYSENYQVPAALVPLISGAPTPKQITRTGSNVDTEASLSVTRIATPPAAHTVSGRDAQPSRSLERESVVAVGTQISVPGKASSDETGTATFIRPPLKSAYQEQEILRVIRELGHDPKALPFNSAGQDGIKKLARKRLKFSKAVFDHAWKRLKADRRIAYVS